MIKSGQECEENMNRKHMSIKYKMASWKLENPMEVQNCQAKGGVKEYTVEKS